jgi:hypothetical protein
VAAEDGEETDDDVGVELRRAAAQEFSDRVR